MLLKLRYKRFGETLETMSSSFWHGGEGCEVAVSAQTLEGRFIGPECAVGRSSIFLWTLQVVERGHTAASPGRPSLCRASSTFQDETLLRPAAYFGPTKRPSGARTRTAISQPSPQ